MNPKLPPPVATPPPALDRQVGGDHYKADVIQHVEYCQRNRIPWCESAAIKYIVRHRKKNGVEDINKAIHYLELLKQIEYPPVEQKIVSATRYPHMTDDDRVRSLVPIPPGRIWAEVAPAKLFPGLYDPSVVQNWECFFIGLSHNLTKDVYALWGDPHGGPKMLVCLSCAQVLTSYELQLTMEWLREVQEVTAPVEFKMVQPLT